MFVDGVLQKYSTEKSVENRYFSIFDIEAESETTYDLFVDASIDGSLDEHFVSVIYMFAPEFVPPVETPNFGFYHWILRPRSIQINSEDINILSAQSNNILKGNNSVLTQAQLDKFGLSDDIGSGYAPAFELLQTDDRYEDYYTLNTGENSLKLTLNAYTTKPMVTDYRVTFL